VSRSAKYYHARAVDYLARMKALRNGLEDRRRKRKRGGEGGELAPVEPDKPKWLSGGAAAALEFDE
jgi:hypothetical protein